ncbi:protein O8 [macacine betaherpesvirus 3]|nr:protein O8 [macacine betaherpesvirus 3]
MILHKPSQDNFSWVHKWNNMSNAGDNIYPHIHNLSSEERINLVQAPLPPWATENDSLQERISIFILCVAVVLFFCFRIPQRMWWFFRSRPVRHSGNC